MSLRPIGHLLIASLGCLAVIPAGAPAAAPPQVERGPVGPAGGSTVKAEPSEFARLIDRVRELRGSGDWQKPGWDGEGKFDKAVQSVLDQARQASARPEFQAGTSLGEVRPAAAVQARVANVLHVARDINASFAERSVFLADGNVRISFATDCVIIAGGAVEVSHGGRNLIIAGHYLQVSHDGGGAARRGEVGGEGEAGSVLLSGNVLDVSHAAGSVCSAPGLVRISNANGVTFVNSPNVNTSHRGGCREVAAAPLALAPAQAANPLAGKLAVKQLVKSGDRRGGAMIVHEHGGVELVTRLGAAPTDGQGKPLDGLADWKLTFVGDGFALFSRGDEMASFILPSQP